MQTLKTTSKILLVVAALGLTAVGCDRRPTDTSGASEPAGSSSSGSSGTSGSSGNMGSSGSGTSGSDASGSR